MEIKSLRKKIDILDSNIVGFLNKRTRLIMDIAKAKAKDGKSIYSPSREQEVLRNIKRANKGPLTNPALESIYKEIISCSRSLERYLRIAYLGPEATFTHLAAMKRFGNRVEYIGCKSIGDVFLHVERGDCEYGVVPIENSIEGAISHTLDMFVDSDLKICAQILLDVSHNLLSNTTLAKIKKVYSNPQVFGQCRIWLNENLSKQEKIEVTSTTQAAKICARTKFSGCIASVLAAKKYGLKIIARDIEDSPHNITRFLVIADIDVEPTGNDRTSIVFSIKDRIGALHDMLVTFKKNKINLTKIESRPSKRRAWDYYFFVDLKGHIQERGVKKALSELEEKCKFLKILGSYPEEK